MKGELEGTLILNEIFINSEETYKTNIKDLKRELRDAELKSENVQSKLKTELANLKRDSA